MSKSKSAGNIKVSARKGEVLVRMSGADGTAEFTLPPAEADKFIVRIVQVLNSIRGANA
jgi:hypothetical protein